MENVKRIEDMNVDEVQAILAKYPKGQMIDSGDFDREVYPAQQRLRALLGETGEAGKVGLIK